MKRTAFIRVIFILALTLCYGCSSIAASGAPTTNPAVIFTQSAQTAVTRLTQTEAVITRNPPASTETATLPADSGTMQPTGNPQAAPTPATGTKGATPSPAAVSNGTACIPDKSKQTGKVLEVLDGNTIRVMIDGKTYTVRYIGIETPEYINTKEFFATESRNANASLVYAKDITLFKDASGADASGRLLRYVMVGDKFVNLQLISKGFAKALAAPPNNACDAVFATAQEQASSAKIGLWNK
jgi:micrococcal nuclease